MIHATLVGRLGKDAFMYDGNNGKFLSFTVATDERAGKDKEPETTWVSCTFNTPIADKLREFLTRGKLVTLTGTVRLRKYTAKDGTQQSTLDMRVENFEFIRIGKGGEEGADNVSQNGETQPVAPITTGPVSQPQAAPQPQPVMPFPAMDSVPPTDDLPF